MKKDTVPFTTRVLVLSGGSDEEHEISARSGTNVLAALLSAGYETLMADPLDPGLDVIVSGYDVVLPILHGGIGENGVLQQRLEQLGVPYLGSSSAVCATTIDKVAYKELLAENGYLTPNWQVVDRGGFEGSGLRRSSYVLKPISGGSSIDMLIIHNPEHQLVPEAQITALFKRHEHMLLEELIEGEEITVGVLDQKALPVIQIIPPIGEEFDYENKYNGRTQEIVNPDSIFEQVQSDAQKLALATHKLFGCRHLSRTDMIVADNGSIYLLEINTMPGLTKQSLFPKAAAAAGYSMPKLVEQFVHMAGVV